MLIFELKLNNKLKRANIKNIKSIIKRFNSKKESISKTNIIVSKFIENISIKVNFFIPILS